MLPLFRDGVVLDDEVADFTAGDHENPGAQEQVVANRDVVGLRRWVAVVDPQQIHAVVGVSDDVVGEYHVCTTAHGEPSASLRVVKRTA